MFFRSFFPLSLLLAGCAQNEQSVQTSIKVPAATNTDLANIGGMNNSADWLLVKRSADAFVPDLLASLSGKITFSDGCLFLTNGSERWLIVWPSNTAKVLVAGQFSVQTQSGSFGAGDYITLKGGQRDGSDAAALFGIPVPSQCRGPFWLVNERNGITAKGR